VLSSETRSPVQGVAHVAVLGCGVIGRSWIQSFLEHGMHVAAWDPDPRAASVLRDINHGDRLRLASSPAEAVQDVDFVQENGPENLALKHQLLAELVSSLPAHAIIASSTSTLQPSELQRDCAFRERVVIGHPFNPPHILPLVEVVPGEHTDAEVVARTMRFYEGIGKHPILLHRERPGHLANRLQAALWREAVDAVASGQASIADVDAAVRLSLGPRWALMGPFATFHLGGGNGGLAHFLDHLGPALESLWDDAHRPEMTEALKKILVEGVEKSVGDASVEELCRGRDVKLAAVLEIAAP
jgi:carnitine 3-dehydrogenase